MRWLGELLRHPGETLAVLLAFLRVIVCDPQPKVDCEQIVELGNNMAQTDVINCGDTESLFPDVYCTGRYMDNIFAVPEPNAIGTNDIDNAIKVLTFQENSMGFDQKTISKDFLEMVSGPFDFRFLPVINDEEIAYSQTRGFIIANIKECKVNIFSLEWRALTGSDIGNLAILDNKTKTFVFEMDAPYAAVDGFKKTLRVLRFSPDRIDTLGEREAGIKKTSYTEPWFTHDGKIFIYTDSTTKLEVFDPEFKPARHPLAEAFNAFGGFRRLIEIAVHPTLPFALVVECGKDPDLSKYEDLPPLVKVKTIIPIIRALEKQTLYLIRWEERDEKQRVIPIVSDVYSIWKSFKPEKYSHFTFSPDGKWLVFRDETGSTNNPNFTAIPIDAKKNPLFFGKPLKLGRVMRRDAPGPTSAAWVTNPTAYAVADGQAVYRWSLGRSSTFRRLTPPPGQQDPRDDPNFGRD